MSLFHEVALYNTVVGFFLSPGGQTFLTHRREGGQTFLHRGGGQTFYVGGGGAYDDVVEEMDVS